MTTYKVYHLESKTEAAAAIRFDGSKASAEAISTELRVGSYRFVAELEADGLDEVFARTQNIENNWTGDEVGLSPAVLAAGGARSTSVGDLIQSSEGEIVIVDGAGFTPIRVAA